MSSEKRERWRREEDEESTGERGEVEEREKRRSGEEERERSPTSPRREVSCLLITKNTGTKRSPPRAWLTERNEQREARKVEERRR